MSNYYVAGIPFSSELYHHGIKGQKWGVRRFQNPDGTLTAAGRERYGNIENGELARNAIMAGRTRYSKANRNEVYNGDMNSLKKKLGKNIKSLDKAVSIAEKAFADDVYRSISDKNNATIARNRNINPFKIKSLRKKEEDLERKVNDILYSRELMASNLSMDVVNKMPKADRDAAMQYVSLLLGYDWG